MIRMMLVDELEEAGLTVIEADGADAALVHLEANPSIAVVVTDIRMPGSMDGLGLASWMHDHTPQCPIIITSGFASPPDFAAINPAIACVWAKPYAAQDVVVCVADLMAKQLG
ncbi:Response regulatory domain-containing protein [Sphingomonas antarctica]